MKRVLLSTMVLAVLTLADPAAVSAAPTPVATHAPSRGFVDTPMAVDGAGGRLLFVEVVLGKSAWLVEYSLYDGRVTRRVNIASITENPTDLAFAGRDYLIVWDDADGNGNKRAAVVTRQGRAKRRYGPAPDIVSTEYRGRPAVVLHKEVARKGGVTRHIVDAYDRESGRRLGRRGQIDLKGDRIERLKFRRRYWSGGFTHLVGLRDGEWNRKADQRLPDYRARYDVLRGTFDRKYVIKNVLAHEKRMNILAQHDNQSSFVAVKRDLSGLTVFTGGEAEALKLAEPTHHYDMKTLEQRIAPGGGVDFSLLIDPVHPDALEKKRAVPAYFDLYRVMSGSSQAKRILRLPPSKRRPTWLATRDFAIILRANRGFARGGSRLDIYKL